MIELLHFVSSPVGTFALAVVIAACSAIDILPIKAWGERHPVRHMGANLLSVAIGVGVNACALWLFLGIFTWLREHCRLFDIAVTPLTLCAAFIVYEFCHYAQHRLEHRTGLFWALHSVHHSCPEMHASVAPRTIWGILILQPVYYLMPLLGFLPAHFLIVAFATNVWGVFAHVHRVPRLGRLEGILMTPANHRVHHGIEPQYLDKNYGQTLVLFDRLFETFEPLVASPTFGLVKPTDERNPFRFQAAGIRELARRIGAAERWRDKALYLVMPPEWSHLSPADVTR